jgi:hypothetical protein
MSGKGCGRKWSFYNSIYYFGICREKVGKTMENLNSKYSVSDPRF